MSTPTLHLVAGANGSGKTTLVDRVLEPTLHLPFVNADRLASTRWPGDELAHAYEASRLAEAERQRLMLARSSFIAETVFSHESKVALVSQATMLGYLVHLHVVIIPVDLAVARVADRVRRGGHDVPEQKTRDRFERLWPLVARAIMASDRADLYDNSRTATALRRFARVDGGRLIGDVEWPVWTPAPLRDALA